MHLRAGRLLLVSLPLLVVVIPGLAGQETPTRALFEDASRADSLIRQITLPTSLKNCVDGLRARLSPGIGMTSARPCCSRVIGKGRSSPFSERRRPLISVSMSLPRTTSVSLTVSGVNRIMAAPARARLIPGAEVCSRRRRRSDVFCGRIVVDRWLEQLGGAGGGGGGGGDGGGAGGDDQPMSRAEADRLLDAVAAEERRVQEERLERNRSRDPVAERNW